jgi:hypothetical protein
METRYPETVDYPVTVAIRNAVDGQDLTSVTVASEEIGPSWTEFDFDDIGVIPEEPYYIVAIAKGGQNTKFYEWGFGDNDPYSRGEAWWRTASPEPTEWMEIPILNSIDFMFQTYGYQEDPPQKPTRPTGTVSGEIRQLYVYTTSTIEPNGEQIYYLFDWGDDTTMNWIGPYESGEEVNAQHSWSMKGNYEIKVKAKDEHGAESPWSDPLAVSMPKTYKHPSWTLIEKIFEWLEQIFGRALLPDIFNL